MPAVAFDLIIIGIYFAIIVGIGWYFSRRNDNVSDFALGGRSIIGDARSPKMQETMKTLLLEVGYTQDVFQKVRDPRELLILNYAIQGWQMGNRKIAPTPPDPTRPARGGAPAPQAPRRVREAESSFDAAPSMRNAFSLAKALKAQRPPGRR